MANKIRFTVGGIGYSIFSEDSEEYIHALGRELEIRMDRLAKQNPFLSTTMVAVLAAMDASDALKKTEEQNNELRRQLKEMTERCTIARCEADRLARKLNEDYPTDPNDGQESMNFD